MSERVIDHKAAWDKGLERELSHWRRWMADPNNHVRFRSDYPFSRFARDEARWPAGSAIKVLDLGSGPASTVGSTWPGRAITVFPVDPLADEYNRLLGEHGYPPAIIKGTGETLLDDIPERDFDFVYSGNALDHCYDPLLCIGNMMQISATGALIMFRVYENVGQLENYSGLHQWDFSIADGALTLNGVPVEPELPHGCKIAAEFEAKPDGGRIVRARISL